MHIHKTLALFFLGCLLASATHAQKHPLTVKAVALINEARKSPSDFLKKHQAEITEREPKFAKQLAQAKPLQPVVWDPGLEAQCKILLDGKDLDPQYQGKNDLCGESSGMHGIGGEYEPMDIVLDFHTNILDPNCKFLGIAFAAGDKTYRYSWGYRCDMVNVAYTFEGKVDSSKVDFAKLNTARDETYLNAAEKRMVLEINFVRAYPKVYAQIIGQHLEDVSNGTWGLDHDDYIAGLELIEELNAQEPLPILTPMKCVFDAAKLHGLDCAKRGFLDHTGSDGSSPWDRILKQCTALEQGNENLQGSGNSLPRYAVISLLIDGGISNRGHRYNMLDPEWRYVGCYLIEGKAMKFGTTVNWVQNFGR